MARSQDPKGLLAHSLRALGHAASIAAVLVLLVNDHILKHLAPSVLTGKLSDFAGLFFFPFLLTACVGLVEVAWTSVGLTRRFDRRRDLRVGLAACALTALAFCLIKLHAGSNAWAAQALADVLGLPVRIAPDPTDLLALPVLGPSLVLWRAVGRRSAPISRRRSLAALGLAALATMATQPCPPEQPISHLVPSDGFVYALVRGYSASGDPPVLGVAYRSADGGGHWEYMDDADVPAPVAQAIQVAVDLPKTACVSGQPETCYRVSGEEWVQASSDAGTTWQMVWAPPASRRLYMERVAAGHGQLLACGKAVDLRAQDLLIVGQGDDHLVLVAVGNEGVLRGRLGQAEWQVVAVGWAEPTPARGTLRDLWPPVVIYSETLIALLAAALTFWALSAMVWSRLAPATASESRRMAWRGALAAVGILVGLAILMVLLDVEELIPMAALPLTVLTAYGVLMVAGWRRAFRQASPSHPAGPKFLASLAGGSLVGAGVWLPFALWVLGVIPGYALALGLGVALAVGALAVVVSRLGRSTPVGG